MGVCISLAQEPPQNPQIVQEPVPQDRPQLPTDNDPSIPSTSAKIPQTVRKRLSQVNPKDIPSVPNKDQVVRARVIDVHDGDTIKVLFEFGEDIMKMSLRILGVDTPEVTASEDRLPEEKVAGLKAKEFVRETLQKAEANGGVRIKITGWDKYGGRALAEVLLPEDTTLTEMLIKNGYARPYNGEKKKKWTLQELTSAPFV